MAFLCFFFPFLAFGDHPREPGICMPRGRETKCKNPSGWKPEGFALLRRASYLREASDSKPHERDDDAAEDSASAKTVEAENPKRMMLSNVRIFSKRARPRKAVARRLTPMPFG